MSEPMSDSVSVIANDVPALAGSILLRSSENFACFRKPSPSTHRSIGRFCTPSFSSLFFAFCISASVGSSAESEATREELHEVDRRAVVRGRRAVDRLRPDLLDAQGVLDGSEDGGGIRRRRGGAQLTLALGSVDGSILIHACSRG
jgi:hypothetical protein